MFDMMLPSLCFTMFIVLCGKLDSGTTEIPSFRAGCSKKMSKRISSRPCSNTTKYGKVSWDLKDFKKLQCHFFILFYLLKDLLLSQSSQRRIQLVNASKK